MKNILLASTMCLMPICQALAGVITIDTVEDNTPEKKFSKDHGAIQLQFSQEESTKYDSYIVGDSYNGEADGKFGQEINWQPSIAKTKPQKFRLNVISRGIHSEEPFLVKKEIDGSYDRRFKVVVTSYTPAEGKKKATVTAEVEDL